ncbi:DUF3857 domain-containing protein [Verrucomicrobiota bacterium]
MKRVSISVPLVCLAVGLGSGGAAWAAAGYDRGILDRAEALAAAREATPEAFPDAEKVLVSSLERIRYEPDGTYDQWYEQYVKVLTEEGRRQYRTLSSYFTIPYQRGPEDCRITLVEIVKPDGRAVPIDVEAQSRIMIDPNSMVMNIYNPNSKVIQVNVSDLDVGDVLHFVMYDRVVQPRMRDTWSGWFVFEGTSPIMKQVIEISAPAEQPLRSIALKDPVEGTVSHDVAEGDGRIEYRWEARDVPRMFPEPNMPPIASVVQRLLVSTASDWQTVSRWYWNISEPHYDATEGVEAEVEELTRGIEDTGARIDALFNFVSQEIRYMGITVEVTAPGYEPHDVKDTFEAKHGVCRDKAALLVVMLRLAGLDAYPTLIHNGTKKDPEVPQPYFNHAIVAVRGEDGSYILIDPTEETATERLPAYLNDKSYLVATPEGDTLRTSPVDPAARNLMRIRTEARVDADGTLEGETVFRFEGANDAAYRRFFARSRPEQRHRFFEGVLKQASAGARVTDVSFDPEEILDVFTTLTVRVSYEADDVLVRNAALALLPLPAMGTQVGMVNFVVGKVGLIARKYPLVTHMACGVREEIVLELDPGLGLLESIPFCEPFETDAVAWTFDMRQHGPSLEAVGDLRLEAVEFDVKQYLDLRDALKQVERDLRRMPVLARAGGEDPAAGLAEDADAVVLDEEVEYVLSSPGAWTESRSVRKRILTYAGKKNGSEIKIGFNTGWEEVELTRAVVTGVDGESHEISPSEINVMDAPWVGAAPRYPPGRTLVASLPAVEVGSVIDFAYRRVCRDRPFFSARESFSGTDAVALKTVRLKAPAGVPLLAEAERTDLVHCEYSTTGETGGDTVHEWRVSGVGPVKTEDMLPPWWTFNPTAFASTGDWETYAGALGRTLTRAASGQERSAGKARELVLGKRNPWDRLEAIADFVALHVRGAGPGLSGLPLSSVTPADRTLADGYGNTTDRAVLIHAMLEAAGFTPGFVLASPLPAIDRLIRPVSQCPDSRVFTEVLVRVGEPSLGLAQGAFVYLGDTDQYAAPGATAHEGRLGLVVPDGELIEIVPARRTLGVTEYRLGVQPDGAVKLTRRDLLYGTAFGAENKRFSEMTPEEKKRHHQELVGRISVAAQAEGDLFTDFSGYPGVVELSVRIPDYAVRDGPFLYFALPDSLHGSLVLRSDSRANPLYLSRKMRRNVLMEIAVPPGFAPAVLPASFRDAGMADGAASAYMRCETVEAGSGTVIEVSAGVEIGPGIVAPEHYAALLDLDRRLSHHRSRTVLLRERQEDADEQPETGE